MHPGRPPLPPNKSYHRPFNYLEYVKDFDPNAHVRVFKVAFKINNETNDVKMIDMFNFTLKDIMFDWCNNYLGDYPYCTFVIVNSFFVKNIEKFKMMNKFTYN